MASKLNKCGSMLPVIAALVVVAMFGCNSDGPVDPPIITDPPDGDGNNGGGGNQPSAPVADFRASATSAIAPVTISFTDESRGQISSWRWEFGNGQTSTSQNPSYRYGRAGSYTVRLTVSGPGGTSTKSIAITIDELLEISYPSIGPLFPSRTRGDCEFDGHGPDVSVSARLHTSYPGASTQYVLLDLSMQARETTPDWSTAFGTANDLIIYTVPSGFYVRSFLSQTEVSWSYRDSDHSYDYSSAYELGRFKAKGDTGGDDICNRTLDDSHVYFYDIRFRLRITPK